MLQPFEYEGPAVAVSSRTTIEEYADIIRMGGVYVVDGL